MAALTEQLVCWRRVPTGGRTGAGAAKGGFSFRYDAGGNVLTRRRVADYPAADGRPALHHEDLLVIYRDHDGEPLSAMYFDSEGHVIRYRVEVEAANGIVRSLSKTQGPAPRFRPTYRRSGGDSVVGDFDIAAPRRSDSAPYLHRTSHRAPAK